MASGTRKPAKRAAPAKPTGVAFACVSQGEIAEVLGVVARQVRNLEKEGLPREVDGYPVARCVRWYVEFKATEALQRARPRAEAPSDRSEAELRKAIAEAGLLELKLERERGDLVEVAAYDAELRRILFGVRRVINNLPGMLASQILHLQELAEARRIVRSVRDNLLRELQTIAERSDADAEEEE